MRPGPISDLKQTAKEAQEDHGLIWTNSAVEVSVRQTNCFQISTGQGWREQTVSFIRVSSHWVESKLGDRWGKQEEELRPPFIKLSLRKSGVSSHSAGC